ncbi:MAG TPA: 3-hydroxyacyl-ACP dehydratase FabZ [Firmicutes bacterium]|jgi:3-hydroxyacyl-[acyl-carrier-protein] dehydratase|nr:3-hydroxyacyl-ACP dehydratase FabZ [Bacillota bacterium]
MYGMKEIQAVLPHRYPFLLVDRILEVEGGRRAVGLKNVTSNEPFFQGHFPGHPIMPGVLIVEALAQVAAFAVLGMDEAGDKLGYFTGIDKFRFRRPVIPGDQLRLEVELLRLRSSMGKARVRATVEGEVAAEGEITFAIVERG